MNVKKMTRVSYAALFCTMAVELCAQPFGYPYDPYNDPGHRSDSPYHLPEGYDPADGFPQRSSPPPSTNKYNGPIKLQSQSYVPSSELNSQSTNHFSNQPLNPADSNEAKIESILDFWFGNIPTPSSFPALQVPLWEGNPQADQELRSLFSQDYQKAANGDYAAWRQTPKGRLALIILLDLFPRHIYRDRAKMFTTDQMALGLAQEGVRKGDDLELFPIERAFFYMPFQQSEDPAVQALSVDLYRKLMLQSPEPIKPFMQEFLKLAVKHKETIDRFGRFPHRNSILDRKSTPEEIDYLSKESSLRY